jgi:hypothetical protein
VLAITDHDQYTKEPSGQDKLTILGATEISLVAPKSGGPLHLLAIGISSMPEIDFEGTLGTACRAVLEVGGLPFVAHPVWSGLLPEELDAIDIAAGIEIYNASCAVEQDRAHADAHWDMWLSQGHRLTGIATDDLHYPGYEAFRAWTMVFAADSSGVSVRDALLAGHFYATTGPRFLDVSFMDGSLIVRCSPVHSIAALANPPFGARVTAGHHELAYHAARLRTHDDQVLEGITEGDHLTGAEFQHSHPGVRYVRIVAEDDQGRRAWTNPIYLPAT